jgi:hypothetical protein
MISVKKIITRKLYEIKTWNLEHTFSNVSGCNIVCSSLLDAEKHRTEHREIQFSIFFTIYTWNRKLPRQPSIPSSREISLCGIQLVLKLFTTMSKILRILYNRSSFASVASLSLKRRYLWISWNWFLDIVCGNIGVWKLYSLTSTILILFIGLYKLQKSNQGIFSFRLLLLISILHYVHVL